MTALVLICTFSSPFLLNFCLLTSSAGAKGHGLAAGAQGHLTRSAHCALQTVLELDGLQFRHQPSWLMSMIAGGNAISSYNHVGGKRS